MDDRKFGNPASEKGGPARPCTLFSAKGRKPTEACPLSQHCESVVFPSVLSVSSVVNLFSSRFLPFLPVCSRFASTL